MEFFNPVKSFFLRDQKSASIWQYSGALSSMTVPPLSPFFEVATLKRKSG
jgi:hypothetical protein